VRQGWIRSDPGPTGGYSLSVSLKDVSVLEVIESIEGPTASGLCVLSDRPCEVEGVCALHLAWVKARTQLLGELDAMTVADTLKED